MAIISRMLSTVSRPLDRIAPLAMFVPVLQPLFIAKMAVDVAQGIVNGSPPATILKDAAMLAIPLGFGRALKAFKLAGGGSPAQFSKLLTDQTSGVLRQVSRQVKSPSFERHTADLIGRLNSTEVQKKLTQTVMTAAKATSPKAKMTDAQIKNLGNGKNAILAAFQGISGGLSENVAADSRRHDSSFKGWMKPAIAGFATRK